MFGSIFRLGVEIVKTPFEIAAKAVDVADEVTKPLRQDIGDAADELTDAIKDIKGK